MKPIVMPGRCVLIVMMIALIISCARLPVIKPVDPAAMPDARERCRRPFLDMPYRFIHSIEVSFPGGMTGTVIGVTVIDPAAKTIHSVIMTIEGFVLFDARYEKEVRVNRAVRPFDAEQFAGYMMDDVRLMFLAPEGKLADAGVRTDGSTVCRYHGNKDTIVDVVVHKDESWDIETYSSSHELLRKIRAVDVRNRIPGMVELRGFGFREYSLHLKLISEEMVAPEVNRLRSVEVPEDDE
jgi:hypothetical protein